MIFSDWVDARDHIVKCAHKAGLHAIAGMFREQRDDIDFLQFCRAFEKVANALNRIDWRTDDPHKSDAVDDIAKAAGFEVISHKIWKGEL